LLDFGWKFTLGNGVDALSDLGFGKGQDDFSKKEIGRLRIAPAHSVTQVRNGKDENRYG